MPNFNRTISLVDFVGNVAGLIGLAKPATVIGNSDRMVASFLSVLNQAGKWLAMKYTWQALQREHALSVVSPTLEYDLPEDWNGYIPDTAWNFSSGLPAVGPVPFSSWQQIRARNLAGTTITLLYRIINSKLVFEQVPSGTQDFRIWYNSRRWVVASDGTTFRDECQANDDVIRYEPFMFAAVVKWKWREARGFSTVAAKTEAMDAIAAAQGRDSPPVTLSTVPVNSVPYLGVNNIPDSGYGS